MRFKRHLELEHGLRQIDIAPLINIVFQLFILFILTSSFIFQAGIKVNLPRVVTSDIVSEENLVISPENTIYLNSRVVTLAELKERLRKFETRTVLIKSDKQASLGRLAEVWDACRDAGISNINIATDQAQ